MKTPQFICWAAGTACIWGAVITAASAQPPSGGRGGPGRGGPPGPQFLLQRFDKNDDGQLTKDEVPEAVWNRLSRRCG